MPSLSTADTGQLLLGGAEGSPGSRFAWWTLALVLSDSNGPDNQGEFTEGFTGLPAIGLLWGSQ